MSKVSMTDAELRNKMIEEILGKKAGKPVPDPTPETPPELEPTITKADVDDSLPTLGEIIGSKAAAWDIRVRNPYSPGDWPDEVRPFIPKKNPHFVYTESYKRFHIAMELGLKVALVGPPGTGKDETALQYAAVMNMPYQRLTGMRNVTPDMVIGHYTMENGTMKWIPLVAELMCRHGGMLVLSEPAAFPADTFFAFQSALETNGYLSIMDHPEATSRMLPINPNTKIVLTSNVRGYGDDVDKYAATNVMDSSTLNRIESMQYIGPMSVDDEVKALSRYIPSIPKPIGKKMVQLGNLIRSAWNKGEIEASWSMRNLVAWGKVAVYTGNTAQGFKDTFFDKMSDKEKQAVVKFWRDVDFKESL